MISNIMISWYQLSWYPDIQYENISSGCLRATCSPPATPGQTICLQTKEQRESLPKKNMWKGAQDWLIYVEQVRFNNLYAIKQYLRKNHSPCLIPEEYEIKCYIWSSFMTFNWAEQGGNQICNMSNLWNIFKSYIIYEYMGWLSIGLDKEDIGIYNAGHCTQFNIHNIDQIYIQYK